MPMKGSKRSRPAPPSGKVPAPGPQAMPAGGHTPNLSTGQVMGGTGHRLANDSVNQESGTGKC